MKPFRSNSQFLFGLVGLTISTGCTFYIDKNPDGSPNPSREMVAKVAFQDVYEKVFRPHCVSCHGNSGGVSLENYPAARSNLDRIKRSAIDERRMPLSPSPPLTNEELTLLSAWIEAGGPEVPVGASPATPAPLTPTFDSIKTNIFEVKCFACHRTGGSAARVPLQTREELINSPLEIVLPGNPEESGLVLVLLPDARKRMPPPDSGFSPVRPEEIEVIERWIADGAAN